MKKIILSSLGGIVLGIGFTFLFFRLIPIETQTSVVYKYDGEKRVENLSFERDTFYADNVDPYGVYNKNGQILSPMDAVKVAEIVLFPIYGEKAIKEQRPYEVTLINESVWSVNGTLEDNSEGGSFHISIDKKDGRILSIWHEK